MVFVRQHKGSQSQMIDFSLTPRSFFGIKGSGGQTGTATALIERHAQKPTIKSIPEISKEMVMDDAIGW